MEVRIYRPAKSAMQSGRANTREWILEYVNPNATRQTDPLMGWTGSDDTSAQVRLHFDTREQAITFAEQEGLNFTVEESRERRRFIKSYADNFSASRKQPWTH